MGKRKDSQLRKPRLSPNQTVGNISDAFIESLGIPGLPDNIPQRLADALSNRVNALLFHLREAKRERYVKPLEVRLVRDTHRAVLTAYELRIPNAENYYARFREIVEDLGYVRTDAGFTKTSHPLT